VEGASFSADGARVAFTAYEEFVGGDLMLWDVAAGKQIATTPRQLARASKGGPVALSPDGSVVAVTGLDDQGEVTLLDAETLEPIGTLRGHVGSVVTEIGFDRRGSKIVTASLDGTVRVWDARTGELIFTPPAEPSGVASVAFNGDGSQIIVIHADGRILAYPVALEDAIEIARSRVTRSLTEAECRTYLHLEACPPS
jgi:WD40 repeat protein